MIEPFVEASMAFRLENMSISPIEIITNIDAASIKSCGANHHWQALLRSAYDELAGGTAAIVQALPLFVGDHSPTGAQQ